MTMRGLLPLSLLLLLLAPRAAAQDLDDGAALQAWRQYLAGITDTSLLLERERAMIDVARERRDSTLLHLQLGLLAIRLGEVTGRRGHFDDAISEFEWAAELEPRWPWPWYGVGLAEERVGDSRISPVAGIKTMMGRDSLTRAADAMREALAREPAFAPALEELSRIALAQRVNQRLDVAVDAVRFASGSEASRQPEILLARGRLERLAGSPDSALIAFREYAASGGLLSLSLLEQARTLFVLDSLSGAEPYYRGAAMDDSVTIALYRADIEVIADSGFLQRFDATTGQARADTLHAFWRRRDQVDLRGENERLLEHYRRMHEARLHFRLAVTRRRYDTDERYRTGGREYDDRGIIYIRHGAPTDSATFVAMDACRNLTWRYDRPDGDLIFHFVARDDMSDFRLVESLMDIADAGGIRRTHQLTCRPMAKSDLALSREDISPIYFRMAQATGSRYVQLAQEERTRGQRDIAIGTTTDRHVLRFADSLDVRAEVAAIGTDSSGRPVAHIAFALRGATAEPRETERGSLYAVRLRFTAFDDNGEVVAWLDTSRTFLSPHRVTPDGFLVGRVTVPVPPGSLRWRLAVDQGGPRGRVFPVERLEVSAPDAPLALSDLALGAPGLSAEWTSPSGELVRLNPLGAWRSGTDLDLYAEVYGIESGAPFAVELTLTRQGGGGFLGLFGGGRKRSLTLTSNEVSRGAASPLRKTVTLTDLAPGQYRLRVVIRDASGRESSRERGVLVRPKTAPAN